MDFAEPHHFTADAVLSLSLGLVFSRHMEIRLRSAGTVGEKRGRDRFTREVLVHITLYNIYIEDEEEGDASVTIRRSWLQITNALYTLQSLWRRENDADMNQQKNIATRHGAHWI